VSEPAGQSRVVQTQVNAKETLFMMLTNIVIKVDTITVNHPANIYSRLLDALTKDQLCSIVLSLDGKALKIYALI